MSETQTAINFNDMADIRTVLFDAEAVPDEVWRALQHVQHASIQADLPREEWGRADELVNLQDFVTYRNTRINPDLLVGHDWHDHQIFSEPMVAVGFDSSNQPVSGVLTAYNTSATQIIPASFKLIDAWIKMLAPAMTPVVGRKRHVHFREGYVHPEVQAPLEVADNMVEVSGIVLAGLYYSLKERDPRQHLVSYIVPDDVVDTSMVQITEAIDMRPTGARPNTLPGFSHETQLVRVQAKLSIGGVTAKIIEMPGARDAIAGSFLRVTEKAA